MEHKHIEPEGAALPIAEVPGSPRQHPVIPARPTKVEHKHVEPEETALSIQEGRTSPHQHPVIPARPKKHEPTEPTPTQDAIAKPEEMSVQDVPHRPKTSEEPALRTAGFAALSTTPVIPPRPTKVKADPTLPKVTMDQTLEVVQTEGGTFQSVEEPNYSKNRNQIETEDILNVKGSTPKEVTRYEYSKGSHYACIGDTIRSCFI